MQCCPISQSRETIPLHDTNRVRQSINIRQIVLDCLLTYPPITNRALKARWCQDCRNRTDPVRSSTTDSISVFEDAIDRILVVQLVKMPLVILAGFSRKYH